MAPLSCPEEMTSLAQMRGFFIGRKMAIPEGIDPKPVQLDVAKTLVDLADKALTRIHSAGFAEVRAKLIFYQSFSTLLLSAHVVAWKMLGVGSVFSILASSLSAGLLCAVLFMSVYAMSGARYRLGAVKGFRNWFDSIKGTPQEQIELYRDLLKRYDDALTDAEAVRKIRGKILRILNCMTLVAMVLSAISLVSLL